MKDAVVADDLRSEQLTERTTLVCSFDPSASIAAGDAVELAVDTRRLHVFDLETGDALELAG